MEPISACGGAGRASGDTPKRGVMASSASVGSSLSRRSRRRTRVRCRRTVAAPSLIQPIFSAVASRWSSRRFPARFPAALLKLMLTMFPSRPASFSTRGRRHKTGGCGCWTAAAARRSRPRARGAVDLERLPPQRDEENLDDLCEPLDPHARANDRDAEPRTPRPPTRRRALPPRRPATACPGSRLPRPARPDRDSRREHAAADAQPGGRHRGRRHRGQRRHVTGQCRDAAEMSPGPK